MATLNQDIPMEVVRRNIDQLGINYNELPQLPFWAPFAGRSQQDFKLHIASKIMAGSSFAGRELTQPEKDALSRHVAKYLVIQAWDTPVAVASAVAFYRGTYANYGFPFWTPKADKFNPNRFPFLPKQFEGALAQKSWHGLRLLAWYAGCKLFVGFFFFSYAVSTFVAASNSDPRLREYNETIQARIKKNRRPAGLKDGQQTRPESPGAQESTSPWASTEQTPSESRSAWPGMQSPQPERSQDSFSDDDSYVFDDASPVAPTQQQKAASQQANQGSAWDRIRSQVRSGGVAQGQGSAQQTSTWGRKREDERTSQGAQEGSFFNFSSGDEEKSYAKEQAQKDFDEMLERERRGETSGRR